MIFYIIVIAVGMFVLGWLGSQNWHINNFLRGLINVAMEEHVSGSSQEQGQEVSEAESER